MQFTHRAGLLSFCLVLLLGLAVPALAAEEAPQGRTYTAGPYDQIPGVSFAREVSYATFLDRCGEQELFWNDWDSDVFVIQWNQEDFDEAVAAGETEFSMVGEYALPIDCSEELKLLWDSGLVTMPETPITTVRIRPQGFITTYSQDQTNLPSIEVARGTPFEEALKYRDLVELTRKEGEPDYDPPSTYFLVTWSQAAYEDGMANPETDSFEITGNYTGPDDGRLEGWVQTEGTPKLVVNLKQPHYEEEIYSDTPYGNSAVFTIYVSPDAQFDTLALPEEAMLMQTGQRRKMRNFALSWNQEDFVSGVSAGKDTFSLFGDYGPSAAWPTEEQALWGSLIRVDEGTNRPQITVHVVRETKYPFTANIVNAGDLVPLFTVPWLNGTEEITCAFSLDNKTWYEEVMDWDWNGNPSTGVAECTIRVYDDNYDVLPIPPDGTVYVKMTVSGSALAGETKVFVLKPPADGNGQWDMTPYDDQSGDHGGGGQGRHDRPGKVDPKPEPEPEPEKKTTPLPVSVPDSEPPIEDTPAPEEPAPSEPEPPGEGDETSIPEPPTESPKKLLEDGTGRAVYRLDDAPKPKQTLAVFQGDGPPLLSAPSAPDVAAADGPAREASAPPATTQTSDAPAPESPAPATHVPGFAAATGATAVLLLGGVAWFHRRKHPQ